MTRWLDDTEGAADALLRSVLPGEARLGPRGRVLAAYQYGDGADALRSAGHDITIWNRHMRGGRAASAEPPAGPFDAVVLRLPKPRHEQEMALHQCLATTPAGGIVIAYGGNDEGIKSFQKVFASLLTDVETIATRGHGRVLRGIRDQRAVRGRLQDWIERIETTIDGARVPWVSYPGLFASGALDEGTALLVGALASRPVGGRVVDFGSGPGMIARTLRARLPSVDLTLVDNDAVALVAASDNVPDARYVLADTLAALPREPSFDAIVSNPPLHSGIREDHAALTGLVGDAPPRLAADGVLWMVVQRRVPCEPLLAPVFETVEVAAENGRFRVWRAATPKRPGQIRAARPRRGRPPKA